MTTSSAKRRTRWHVAAVATAFVGIVACANNEGEGTIEGTLHVDKCWSGDFNLTPDFYAAVPFRESLQIRVQSGGDFQTFSDGLIFSIDDVHAIRPSDGSPGLLGQPLIVSLPKGVAPPGMPVVPTNTPARVHAALYLQRTCKTENVALHALGAVRLSPSGACDADVEIPKDACSLQQSAAPEGRSTITFTHLFNASADETSAAEKLTEGTFDLYLADPREICPGVGVPPPCRGHLRGSFRFYFQRGRPGQPFP